MPLLPNNLGNLKILEVFEEHDFPCLFVCEADTGKLYLAVWIARGTDTNEWLYVEISTARLELLRNGDLKLRAAFAEAESGEVQRLTIPKANGDTVAKVVPAAELTDDILPSPTATLIADDLPLPDLPLRTAEEIEKQILALPPAISAAIGLPNELKAAKFIESGNDGQIAFDGAPVQGHEVQARFFAPFWEMLQALVDEAAKAIFADADVELPDMELMLGMTSRSSYAIDLRIGGANVVPPDTTLFETPPANDTRPSKMILEAVSSMLFDESKTAETIELVNRFPQLRQRYGAILELLSNKSADISFRTRRNPRGRKLTHMSAGEQFQRVRVLGYPYGHLFKRGELTGGNVRRVKGVDLSFTLVVSEKEIYTGTLAGDAIEKMKGTLHWESQVDAKIQVEDDAKKPGHQTYKLLDVTPVESETR